MNTLTYNKRLIDSLAHPFAIDIDTLEQGAFIHAMTEAELDEMINEINAELEKEWREKHVKKNPSAN